MSINVSDVSVLPISILKDIFGVNVVPSGRVFSLKDKLYQLDTDQQLAADQWEGGEIEVWGVNKVDRGWTSGPMVGHVSAQKANIWAWGGVNPKFRIKYWKQGDATYSGLVDMEPDDSTENFSPVRAVLENLLPDTIYKYTCFLEDAPRAFRKSGKFKTAPLETSVPDSFKVAISSCMNRRDDKIQYAVNGIYEENPDLQFLIGDSVYYDCQGDEHDPPGPDGIWGNRKKDDVTREEWWWKRWFWTFHIKQRKIESFARNLRNIPTYSTWDDHDYVENNPHDEVRPLSGGYSRKVFDHVWINPGNAGVNGIYYNFKRGREVEFFVLDGRTNLDGSNNQMFGDAQLTWLFEKLNESSAIFKIIIAGSNVKRWHKANNDEDRYFDDKDKIQGILNGKHPTIDTRGKRIMGVIIVTGDIHLCDLRIHDTENAADGLFDLVPYTIYEVISTGIAVPFHKNDVRPEGFAFATLTFEPGVVVIKYHRHDNAFEKYYHWLEYLTNDELKDNILVGVDFGEADQKKIADEREKKRNAWLDLPEMSSLPADKTIYASEINKISIGKIASKNNITKPFRILSDLLKKSSTSSLYNEEIPYE